MPETAAPLSAEEIDDDIVEWRRNDRDGTHATYSAAYVGRLLATLDTAPDIHEPWRHPMPETAAGRALPETEVGRSVLTHIIEDANGYVVLTSGRFTLGWLVDALRKDIPAIEAEARALGRAEALAEALDRYTGTDPEVLALLTPRDTPEEARHG